MRRIGISAVWKKTNCLGGGGGNQSEVDQRGPSWSQLHLPWPFLSPPRWSLSLLTPLGLARKAPTPRGLGPRGHCSGSVHLFPKSPRRCHRPAEGASDLHLWEGGVIDSRTAIPQPAHGLPDGPIDQVGRLDPHARILGTADATFWGNCSQSGLPQGHITGARRRWGLFLAIETKALQTGVLGTSCQSKGCDPMGSQIGQSKALCPKTACQSGWAGKEAETIGSCR